MLASSAHLLPRSRIGHVRDPLDYRRYSVRTGPRRSAFPTALLLNAKIPGIGPLNYLDRNNRFTMAIGLANSVTRLDPEWYFVMVSNLNMMILPVVLYFAHQKQLIGWIASVGIKG